MFQLCACHSDIPQYNSSETFRNVPLLLSHVCLCAVRFDGYVWSSNNLYASGMKMPARGKAALALRYDLPLLLLSAVAQPLAALTPYGCGTPLAGAALLIL